MTIIERQLKESVDRLSTAQAQRKPRNDCINWSRIKQRWINGDSVTDIATEQNIKRATIYSHADRFDWPKRGAAHPAGPAFNAVNPVTAKALEQNAMLQVAVAAPIVTEEAKQHLRKWFDGIVATATTLHRAIDSAAERKLEVEEIKSLAISLNTVDQVARRTFGLDQPGASNGSVWLSSTVARQCPVIDVEALPVAQSNDAQ